MRDSASVLVLTDADTNPVLTDEPCPPLSVALLDPEVAGVVSASTTLEVAVSVSLAEDKVADELDVLAWDRDRDDDDSAPACALNWVREDVNPDDVDEVEDADADADGLEDELELGVIVELVNRDFDEEEGVDVAATDENEDLDVDVDATTDVDVNLVEERDEESLVAEAADVVRGSSAVEVVSDPAPASPFARLVEVTAPTTQIC